MDWRSFVYGGCSSVVAECGTFPIDTTKTRLQLQGQTIDLKHQEMRYRGMLHAFWRIAKEEGIMAVYSGISPALLRQLVYGSIKVGLYYSIKQLISTPENETLLKNICAGIPAGVISSCVANPTDVLKVRMQAKNEHFAQLGLVSSFKKIYRTEGLKGLWRGVGPTAQRAAIVAGVEFPAYDISKKHLLRSQYFQDGIFTHFIASVVAGFAGAIASNPVDVVKTRLMNQRKLAYSSSDSMKLSSSSLEAGLSSHHLSTSGATNPSSSSPKPNLIYRSSIHCLLQTVRTEGVFALYKGFIPNWMRLGPWNVIFFITLEQLRRVY